MSDSEEEHEPFMVLLNRYLDRLERRGQLPSQLRGEPMRLLYEQLGYEYWEVVYYGVPHDDDCYYYRVIQDDPGAPLVIIGYDRTFKYWFYRG